MLNQGEQDTLFNPVRVPCANSPTGTLLCLPQPLATVPDPWHPGLLGSARGPLFNEHFIEYLCIGHSLRAANTTLPPVASSSPGVTGRKQIKPGGALQHLQAGTNWEAGEGQPVSGSSGGQSRFKQEGVASSAGEGLRQSTRGPQSTLNPTSTL